MLSPQKRLNIFAPLLISEIILTLILCALTNAYSMKTYVRSFKIATENASLTLTNPAGSIKIRSWNKPEINVTASLLEDTLEIKDRQAGDSVQIDVHCSKAGEANFDINVPQNSTLDLRCLKGTIEVTAMEGRISVQTTEGNISLVELRSTNITAKSISGAISYNGKLSPQGIYNFQSIDNNVDLTLPANSAFTLMATTATGKIDLGGFVLTDSVPHEQRVSGKCANGSSALNLSSHRGQIRLRKAAN